MKERNRKCRGAHCQRNCSAWILLRFHNSIPVRLCLNTTGLHKVHQINCWPAKFLIELHGLWLFFCMHRYTNPATFASLSACFHQERYIHASPFWAKVSIISAKSPQLRNCYISIQVNVILKFQLRIDCLHLWNRGSFWPSFLKYWTGWNCTQYSFHKCTVLVFYQATLLTNSHEYRWCFSIATVEYMQQTYGNLGRVSFPIFVSRIIQKVYAGSSRSQVLIFQNTLFLVSGEVFT